MQKGGVWVALVTPMHQDQSIDFDAVSLLIEQHVEAGVTGIVLLGTTAESPTLTLEEKTSLLMHACCVLNQRLPILVGIGCNNLHDVDAWMAQCETQPVDGYMVTTPFYNKPTTSGLIAFYEHCLSRTKRPILAYNVPSRTGCDMDVEVLNALSVYPNFLGLKDATGDLRRVWQYRQRFPNMLLLSGDDATFLPYMKLGGDGVISVAANVFPQTIARICHDAHGDRWQQAMQLDASLRPFYQVLASSTNPIPCKQVLSLQHVCIENTVRLPLISEATHQKIEDVYHKTLATLRAENLENTVTH